MPFYALVGLALCEAILRFLTEFLSIFWSGQDSELNILITGYVLIPLIGAYGLTWCTYLMSPSHKEKAVIAIGSLYSISVFFLLLTGGFGSDIIVERITQSNEVSLFASILRTGFTILGVWMGIKSAKNNSFWAILN